ncbi:nitrilase-related carbon-nitrogen hydrolase [Hippea alviniae]|uniref:nitrilase-related carbon-nitrogen hydrolase n=1 Tax=Hippea alviniae TaxID=1279027 RepID=UPI0003B47823|nr:nitrilase-related carbon-nitrogen hydrolase [Hippea alviniae]
MRVAVGQMQVIAGDVDKNFSKGIELIKQAKDEKCELILLPEVWTTGFLFKKLKELSKTTPEILKEIKAISNDICICGSYVVDDKESDKVFNIFYAIKDGKIIFEYRKTMLFGSTGEDKYFRNGGFKQKNTFIIDNTTIGVSICYELRFPEFFRKAALNGAVVYLHPAIWPETRLEHWNTLTKARAIENQLFLLTSNGVGMSGKWKLAGYSTIFNGWGEILTTAQKSEGIFTADLNIDEVKKIREQLPSLVDSKIFRELYT